MHFRRLCHIYQKDCSYRFYVFCGTCKRQNHFTSYRTLSPCYSVETNPHRRWSMFTQLDCSYRFYATHIANEFSLRNSVVHKYVKHLQEKYEKATIDLCSNTNLRSRDLDEARKCVASFKTVAELFKMHEDNKAHVQDLEQLMLENGNTDMEMKDMLEKELREIHNVIRELDRNIVSNIVSPDRTDHNDIIIELTAGVGGQEAMLFAKEMLDMYMNYASYKGWDFQLIHSDFTSIGGLRKATGSISGQYVYKYLKYEGGVHRVQRIPKTEKTGRMHTSTMSIAVLPQPTEIDVVIRPEDLIIETHRASGAGGQHVNTTDSAVRVTHKPSGMVVECQTGRSQLKNRENAIRILRTRLYDEEMGKQFEEQEAKRKIQTGTRSRNEKIRTYNFAQDRITDHRLSSNMNNLEEFMTGGDNLDEIIERLMEASRVERLHEELNKFKTSENV